MLWCTNASCLDVESLCGSSIGARGSGLAITNIEVDDSDYGADHSEDKEHKEQGSCVEREGRVILVPYSVLCLVVDHLVQVHGHQIIVFLLGLSFLQLILAKILFL